MVNKNNYFIKGVLMFFVLTFCFILTSCNKCKNNNNQNDDNSNINNNLNDNFTLEIGEINDTLYVNEPINLTYNSSKDNVEVTWKLSDDSLAVIENSTLIPLQEGTLTITVYCTNNPEIFASHTCTILQKEPESLSNNIDNLTMFMVDSI